MNDYTDSALRDMLLRAQLLPEEFPGQLAEIWPFHALYIGGLQSLAAGYL